MKLLKDEKGQSSIEYVLTFAFSVGILILFIRLAINMSAGYLAHYATFMASRAYFVLDTNSQEPRTSDNYAGDAARDVFNNFQLEKFGIPSSSSQLEFFSPDSGRKNVYVGPRFEFEVPLTGFAIFGGSRKLNLVSESFLGREPVAADCFARVCSAMQEISQGAGCESHATLYDNGC